MDDLPLRELRAELQRLREQLAERDRLIVRPQQAIHDLQQRRPAAQAAIVYLNKHGGLSYGKIADAYQRLFGISLTRGACAQVVLRGGRRLRPAYEQIRARLTGAEHLTPDETGWRVGGHPAWL